MGEKQLLIRIKSEDKFANKMVETNVLHNLAKENVLDTKISGCVNKCWINDKKNLEVLGFYLFESEQQLDKFRDSKSFNRMIRFLRDGSKVSVTKFKELEPAAVVLY
jgi:hypothetical protein